MIVLEELTGPELRRRIDYGVETAIIPFGSVEEHGGHLPLGADAILADLAGHAVADRLGAVLAPTVRVGAADQHMDGTGTLTIPAETLREVAVHIAQSLVTHEFRVIALISTHGGNLPALEDAAQQLNEVHRDVVVCAPRGDVGSNPGAHSGKWLTSVMLALRPDLVKAENADESLIDEVRAVAAEDGADNFERYVSSMVQHVRDAIERRRARTG